MNDAYFRWLVGLIGDDYIMRNYQRLLWKLYTREYVWELDLDENRAADGLYLRRIYVQNMGIPDSEQGLITVLGSDGLRPCSVLEMLIALARRAEDDLMHDPDFGDRSGVWFWDIMENLGLDVYDDYHFFESEVDKILDVFLHHRYLNNGSGGAFPLHFARRDMTKTDLYWQMNAYMEEQFGV